MTITIVNASTSVMKVRALDLTLTDLDATDAEALHVKAASDGDEQPLGYDVTLACALSRLQNAEILHPNADIYVAMENGIFREDLRFIDRAVVIVRYNDTNDIAISQGIVMPVHLVALSVESNLTKTVGQLMFQAGMIDQADNPHRQIDLVEEPGVKKPRPLILRNTLLEPLRKALEAARAA